MENGIPCVDSSGKTEVYKIATAGFARHVHSAPFVIAHPLCPFSDTEPTPCRHDKYPLWSFRGDLSSGSTVVSGTGYLFGTVVKMRAFYSIDYICMSKLLVPSWLSWLLVAVRSNVCGLDNAEDGWDIASFFYIIVKRIISVAYFNYWEHIIVSYFDVVPILCCCDVIRNTYTVQLC